VGWERVLADVAAQAEQIDRDEDLRAAADRVRVEHAAVAMLDRLRGHGRCVVVVVTSTGATVRGRPEAVGPDWLALDGEGGTTVLPAHAVVAVRGLGRPAVPAEAMRAVDRRKDLRYLLRALGSEGVEVLVRTAGPDVRGQVTRVGADHIDLAADGETWSVRLAALDHLVV
jgi:hypothetical protein